MTGFKLGQQKHNMSENIKSISPLGDRVLVKEHKIDKNKKGTAGFILPDSATAEDAKYATVISVGPGLYTHNGTLIPMTVNVGDIVILPSFFQSAKVKLNGEELDLIRESDLLGIVINSVNP